MKSIAIKIKAIIVFKDNLEKQTQNVTEAGEKKATDNLKNNFALLEKNSADEIFKNANQARYFCNYETQSWMP